MTFKYFVVIVNIGSIYHIDVLKICTFQCLKFSVIILKPKLKICGSMAVSILIYLSLLRTFIITDGFIFICLVFIPLRVEYCLVVIAVEMTVVLH